MIPQQYFIFHMFTVENPARRKQGAAIRLSGGNRYSPDPEQQMIVAVNGFAADFDKAIGSWRFEEAINLTVPGVAETDIVTAIAKQFELEGRALVTSDPDYVRKVLVEAVHRLGMGDTCYDAVFRAAPFLGVDVIEMNYRGRTAIPAVVLSRKTEDNHAREALYSRLGLAAGLAFLANELQYGRDIEPSASLSSLTAAFFGKANPTAPSAS